MNENNLDPSEQCATLIIEQRPTTKQNIVSEFPLQQVRQQRLHTEWLTSTPQPRWASLFSLKTGLSGSKQVPNVFRVSVKIPEGSPAQSVLLGTKIHANLHSLAWPWFIGGCTLFFAWISAGASLEIKTPMGVMYRFLTLLFFRAGTFISNDFFLDTSGQAAVFKTSFGHLRHWFSAGEWYPHVYKPAGSFILPMIMMLIEPFSGLTPTNYYIETYPLPRYIWFLAETAGALVLVHAIYKYLSPKVAVLFPLIYVTFPPILFDMYNMEDDALLILGMLFLTALIIRIAAKSTLAWKDLFLCAAVMLFMLSAKITPVFLVVIIPIALLAARFRNNFYRSLKPIAVLLVLLISVIFGSKFITSLCSPTVREAQPGFPYQDHVFWDMAWAANGLFDYETAHPFLKKGSWRDNMWQKELRKRLVLR